MEELENFNTSDEDYAVESDFIPLFKKAQIHSFLSAGILWADTWIVPLQGKDGTFSFLLIDSQTYQTLNSQEHFLMGYGTAREAIQVARIYLGQCMNKFLTTFDTTGQKWPPLC